MKKGAELLSMEDEQFLPFLEILLDGSYAGRPEIPYHILTTNDDKVRDVVDAIERETASQVLKDFMVNCMDKFGAYPVICYVFDYEDSNEMGSMMEHGGIFDHVPHIRVSNH